MLPHLASRASRLLAACSWADRAVLSTPVRSAMPQPEVERRQAALDRERYKFLYYPGPGGYSHLADIVLGNMLQYGAGLQS